MTTAARACPACQTPLPEEAQFCLHCGAATPTDPDAPPRTAATGVVEVSRVRKALADRYRVDRVLGEGGMATVYLAEDLRHRRKVAVKVMRAELAATLGAERFLREIEIAAQLNHPHILPVHDSGDADGVLYYVMPYVEGESLRERVHRDGALPPEEALRLAREVAEALAYAHARGIIHRDIKPANILLGAGHALVADFGIARAMSVGGEALTQTGLAVGTPQYMSPEQASGEPNVDARADVYAVGGILYEMLAGEPPYTGPTPQAILAKALTEEVPLLTQVRPGVPAPAAEVVARATARRPADRYASADALAAALSNALDVVRTSARGVPEKGPSTVRVWGTFALATVVTLAAVFGLVQRWGLARWTLGLAAGLLAIGAGVLFATGRVEARRRAGPPPRGVARWLTWRNAALGGVLAGVLWVGVALALVFRGPASSAGRAGGVRLAVLPFENRGDPADAYIVDGVADQIRGKLTGLGGFQITARTSSDQYRQTTKSPQEIARELGVDYLLTATVVWAKSADGAGGGRVRVVPELIDARTGAATWQQAFDADLTDVFQVQGDIAVRVAGALNVALGDTEQRALATPPTANLAAYEAFLKGDEAARTGSMGARAAINFFERAVALDSTFALAWARLAQAHATAYFSSPTPLDGQGTQRAAERARALAPDAPGTHMALGEYYRVVLLDLPRARRQYEEGLRGSPNDPGLLAASAVAERSAGRWDASVALLRRVRELDPRSTRGIGGLASNLLWMRRYPEALAEADRGLALAPDHLTLLQVKAMVHLARGDLGAARSVLRGVPGHVDPTVAIGYFAISWDTFWMLDDEQQRLVLRLGPGSFGDDRGGWALTLAGIYHLRGDAARARAYGDSARMVFAATLHDVPDDNYLLALHALACAYAGRGDEAVRDGERSLALLPIEQDGFSGPYNQHLLARVYTLLGQRDKAIDQLEHLLRFPYFVSPGWLRIDPNFESLRGHPRFERLTAAQPTR